MTKDENGANGADRKRWATVGTAILVGAVAHGFAVAPHTDSVIAFAEVLYARTSSSDTDRH